MKYLSVCAGIEAASVAWHHMGWEPVAFSEIEKFPSAVLAHHYPNVPNWGDMTKFKEWPNESIDVLVGGTPCQSFSVAGLREGLADPRGNLMLTYLAIADKYRPEWLVWENVPGVLSSNGGRDFASLLRGMAELGYGFSYRILDAQYFGVAQRRRRVFVVGYLGDWHRAAAVLFERESLCGNPAPRRETGKATPALSASGTGISRPGFNSEAGFYVAERTGTMTARLGHNAMGAPEVDGNFYIPTVAGCLNSVGGHAVPGNSLQDADQGYLIPLQQPMPCSFPWQQGGGQHGGLCEDYTMPLTKNQTLAVAQYIGGVDYEYNSHGMDEATGPLLKGSPTGGGCPLPAIATAMQVRRLTPVECERLQGFPDGYTLIPIVKQQPIKGQPNVVKMAADGPRYRALGNSMAVPVMRWIGERINKVEAL